MRHNLQTRPVVLATWRDPATQELVDDPGTTVTFTKPDGSSGGAGVITHDGLGTYLGKTPADVDVAGAWRFVAEAPTLNLRVDGAFVVTADNADQPWAPQLADIGARIPLRTIELGGSNLPMGTFTPLTMPQDIQVEVLIDGAVGYVAAAVGTIDPTLWDLATEVASLRTAAAVELAQPADQFDQRRYDQLMAAAESTLTRLVARNDSLTPSGSPGAGLLPVGSFPEAPWYGDCNL